MRLSRNARRLLILAAAAVATGLAYHAMARSQSSRVIIREEPAVWPIGWTYGFEHPEGPCANGSLYSRVDGGKNSTLFVCEAGAWAAK